MHLAVAQEGKLSPRRAHQQGKDHLTRCRGPCPMNQVRSPWYPPAQTWIKPLDGGGKMDRLGRLAAFMLTTASLLGLTFGPAAPVMAGQPPAKAAPPSAVYFKNVKVFDGKSDRLTGPTSVLVVGNKIEKIGRDISA